MVPITSPKIPLFYRKDYRLQIIQKKKKKVHCQAVPTTNTQVYCTLSLSSRPKCVPGVNKIFMKILLPTVFRNVTLLTSVWTLPSRLPQLIFTEFLRALSSKEPEKLSCHFIMRTCTVCCALCCANKDRLNTQASAKSIQECSRIPWYSRMHTFAI